MTITVRSATESDIPFILQGNHVIDRVGPDKPQRGLTAEYLKQDFFSPSPKAFIDIVEVDGQPAAFMLYSFFYLASIGQVIWVSKLYIDPFSRKMGLGPAMRDHLFKKYPHIPAIYGSTVTLNKVARVFFTSLGAENLNGEFVYYVVKKKS
jgi:hypothetical protein